MSKKKPDEQAEGTGDRAPKKRDEFKRALVAAGLSILSVTKVSGAPYRLYRVIAPDDAKFLITRNPDDSWVMFAERSHGHLSELQVSVAGVR